MATLMHIIAADWYHGDLSILADDDGTLRDVRFEGTVDWTVQPGRHCVGRLTRDGHIPCPLQAPVAADRQCGHCAPAWSDCVFEPVQHGPDDACTLCRREHVVYLAFYGALPKVGMTSSARVETRLREQGADAYFIVQRRRDRYQARQTEKTVAFLHGIPERRRSRELVQQWTRAIDRDLIGRRAGQWRDVLADRFDVESPVHLEHPLPVLPAAPDLVEVEGHHHGKVFGAKGNLLVYQAPGGALDVGLSPVRALKRGELVGRDVVV